MSVACPPTTTKVVKIRSLWRAYAVMLVVFVFAITTLVVSLCLDGYNDMSIKMFGVSQQVLQQDKVRVGTLKIVKFSIFNKTCFPDIIILKITPSCSCITCKTTSSTILWFKPIGAEIAINPYDEGSHSVDIAIDYVDALTKSHHGTLLLDVPYEAYRLVKPMHKVIDCGNISLKQKVEGVLDVNYLHSTGKYTVEFKSSDDCVSLKASPYSDGFHVQYSINSNKMTTGGHNVKLHIYVLDAKATILDEASVPIIFNIID